MEQIQKMVLEDEESKEGENKDDCRSRSKRFWERVDFQEREGEVNVILTISTRLASASSAFLIST